MHADHGVMTGTHHSFAAQPCQDYCQSGEIPDGAWAAISDGCSGADGRSDLGARVMVLSAEAVLKERGASIVASPGAFQDALLNACRAWMGPLPAEDMFATLCVVAGSRTALHAMVWGDGAILIKYLDGRLSLVEVAYPENAPEYPAYRLRPEWHDKWRAEYRSPPAVTKTTVGGDGTLLEKVALDGLVWSFAPDKEGIACIAVASDGIGSRSQVASIDTAMELMGFKSTTGAFVQRRLGTAARRVWRETGTEPADDLSMSAIWVGD